MNYYKTVKEICMAIETGYFLTKCLMYKRQRHKMQTRQERELLILGNGPSTKILLDHEILEKKSVDWLCVNDFCRTSYFTQLKPYHFVVIDPLYFSQASDLLRQPKDVMTSVKSVQKILVNDVDWSMNIYIPFLSRHSELATAIRSNPHIKVHFITPVEGTGLPQIYEMMMRHGYCTPILQNVLIAAIYIGVWEGYKEIVLIGAEHDWIKHIYVDKKNLVRDDSKYFYDDERCDNIFFDQMGKPIRIGQLLYQLSLMFQGYEQIARLADWYGAKIYNGTPGSYIDSFARKKLENYAI